MLNESSDELLIVPPADYPQGKEGEEADEQEPPMEISASFVRSSSRIESSSSSDDSSSDEEGTNLVAPIFLDVTKVCSQ